MGVRAGLCFGLTCLLACSITSAFRLPEILRTSSKGNGTKVVDWALLVAGSSGWGNYRHQADVCHAYQVLKNGGVDDDHIVVMMADDLANNVMNPHPGKLFNRPYGPDVYDGVPLDYTGENVNADTFLKVLAGHQNDTTLIGTSGKVIRSGPEDRVFVYYADHGAPGIVGMPSGSFLYADQLLKTLQEKADQKGFKDLVIYLEACEAGSMFEGMIPDELNVYATTAANAEESSWGTYCPGMSPMPPAEFDTCLGDLYSVAWMENSDHYDLTQESLEMQFEKVKRRTSNDGTFLQGSHVKQYGSLVIDEEPASDYLGLLNTGDGTVSAADKSAFERLENGGHQAIPQREADLVPLWTAVTRATNVTARQTAYAALTAVLDERASLDAGVRAAVMDVLQQPRIASAIVTKFNKEWAIHSNELQKKGIFMSMAIRPPSRLWVASQLKRAPATDQMVDVYMTQPIIQQNFKPLVEDWDCLRAMVKAWEGHRGPLDQYGMQHTRAFANLCNSGVTPCAFRAAVARTTANMDPGQLSFNTAQDMVEKLEDAMVVSRGEMIMGRATRADRMELSLVEPTQADVMLALLNAAGADAETIVVRAVSS